MPKLRVDGIGVEVPQGAAAPHAFDSARMTPSVGSGLGRPIGEGKGQQVEAAE